MNNDKFEAWHKISTNIINSLINEMEQNRHYTTNDNDEQYDKYWAAKNKLNDFYDNDVFVDDLGQPISFTDAFSGMWADKLNHKSTFINKLMEQEMSKPNTMYEPKISPSGKFIKVPIMSPKGNNYWTTKHIPSNGRLAESVLDPITGDIIHPVGYWPTNNDIGSYFDRGIEWLTYSVSPEHIKAMTDEDRAEIASLYDKLTIDGKEM